MEAETGSEVAQEVANKPWWLYLLECRRTDGKLVLYAGITTDVDQRFQAHVSGRGAKFTRANPPVRVAARRCFPGRSEAARAEWQVKQLPRASKVGFVEAGA